MHPSSAGKFFVTYVRFRVIHSTGVLLASPLMRLGAHALFCLEIVLVTVSIAKNDGHQSA